jgi:hypothetical protein
VEGSGYDLIWGIIATFAWRDRTNPWETCHCSWCQIWTGHFDCKPEALQFDPAYFVVMYWGGWKFPFTSHDLLQCSAHSMQRYFKNINITESNLTYQICQWHCLICVCHTVRDPRFLYFGRTVLIPRAVFFVPPGYLAEHICTAFWNFRITLTDAKFYLHLLLQVLVCITLPWYLLLP